jgi:cephalosporin hydroxylase
MNEPLSFEREKKTQILKMAQDQALQEQTGAWVKRALGYQYTHHFTWLGLPIIQFPQDMIAMQELVWQVKPDLIIETGIARGGSLIFYASILEMIGENGRILGIDIDIRSHNRENIENHPMFKNITLFEGSSIASTMIDRVYQFAQGKKRIMVVLDSNHTFEHVLNELNLYSPLVTKGSYLVVFDTIVENFTEDLLAGRPWGKGNSPQTAVDEFLIKSRRFIIDQDITAKLLITAASSGYLRCVAD